nr:hypothetical protein [Candidatus Njordarchaeum guaymaensis]
MRKRIICCLAILSMFMIGTIVYSPAMAANYNNVGVKMGDKAVYQVKTAGGLYNKTIIQVYSILPPKVYLNITRYKPEGSVYDTHWWNRSIATWDTGMCYYLIAGSLSAGNNFTVDSTSINITKTETMTAAGASRSVNYVNGTIPYILGLYLHDCYYDKETGLLVKGDLSYFGSWTNQSLISTTAWSPAAGLFGWSWTTWAIIGGAAIVTIVMLAVVLRRKH